jgi:hypothetical protein
VVSAHLTAHAGDTAQSELDRFLKPINASWYAKESAIVRELRVRIPA